MSALMSKMKHLNSKFTKKNLEDPESPEVSEKIHKRKMILTKLNEIENNLTELMNEEESCNKLNHITSSQITLRYNPII